MSHRNISDLLELLDSIVEVPGVLPVTEEPGRELDRRLETHKESPGAAVPWGKVRKRLIEAR